MAARDTPVLQYAVKFETEKQCLEQAEKLEDKRTSFRTYPIQHATCVMEVKR